MKQTESEFNIESKKAILELKKLEGGQLRVHHKGGRVKGRASKLFNLNPLQLHDAIYWGDYQDVLDCKGFPLGDGYFKSKSNPFEGRYFAGFFVPKNDNPPPLFEKWVVGKDLLSWIGNRFANKDYKYLHRLIDFLEYYRHNEGITDGVRLALFYAWVSCNMRTGAFGRFPLKDLSNEKMRRRFLEPLLKLDRFISKLERGIEKGVLPSNFDMRELRCYIDSRRLSYYEIQHSESTTRESFFKRDKKTKYAKYSEVIKLAQYYKSGAEKKNFDHLCKLLREMGLPKGKATLAV